MKSTIRPGNGAVSDSRALRRLIINADDFGYSEGVTRGILEAHAAGVLTSTTLLPNMPGFEDAVSRSRDEAPALGVGLHLNLVQGEPIERVPTLTDPRTGHFYPLLSLVRRVLSGRVDPEEVEAECAAQIARLRSAGIAITHLDSHQHTHALPGLWHPIVRCALSRGIRFFRWPVESPRVEPANLVAELKKAGVAAAWRVARTGAPRAGHPAQFVGISLQGGKRVLPRLLRVLDGLRPGTTELMMHVGRVDEALRAVDPYTWQRERELEALTSAQVRARLGRGDIQLVHFGVLA
jgi:predicted glycoside hydrolase/deacetylase ChbG (UPF0249 family)